MNKTALDVTTTIEDAITALNTCLETMEMQENRMNGSFHIPAHTALHIWNAAKEQAQSAIDGLRLL